MTEKDKKVVKSEEQVKEKPVEKTEEKEPKQTKKLSKKEKHPADDLDELLGISDESGDDLGDVPDFLRTEESKPKKENSEKPKKETSEKPNKSSKKVDDIPDFLKL